MRTFADYFNSMSHQVFGAKEMVRIFCDGVRPMQCKIRSENQKNRCGDAFTTPKCCTTSLCLLSAIQKNILIAGACRKMIHKEIAPLRFFAFDDMRNSLQGFGNLLWQTVIECRNKTRSLRVLSLHHSSGMEVQ